MNAIHGTYLNGMIVPDVRPEWVEGARVCVNLDDDADLPADDDESPEAIAKRVALMDEFMREPVMTDEEAEEFERHLKEQKARELASWSPTRKQGLEAQGDVQGAPVVQTLARAAGSQSN